MDRWVEIRRRVLSRERIIAQRVSEFPTTADATANEDAVAVELFRGASDSFLGMSAPGSAVDMWFWDADRQSAPGIEDTNHPNIVVDVDPFTTGPVASAAYQREGTKTEAQPPISLTAAVGNPIVPGDGASAASSLETAGPVGDGRGQPVEFHLQRECAVPVAAGCAAGGSHSARGPLLAPSNASSKRPAHLVGLGTAGSNADN